MKRTILILTTILSISCNVTIAQNINEIKTMLTEASKENTFLKDFSIDLKPNQSARYSVVLSKNTKYAFLFYQTESNQLQFIITDEKDLSFEDGSLFAKQGIAVEEYSCTKTGVYHLEIKNLSNKQFSSIFLLTFIENLTTDTSEEIIPTAKSTHVNDSQKESYLEGDESYFFVVEEMPKFNGKSKDYDEFKKFIGEELRYPQEAIDKKIEGKVFVQFVIGKDGYIKEAKIARGIHPSLDQEALRAVYSSPRWEPGKQRGQAVNVVFTFPITFKLP